MGNINYVPTKKLTPWRKLSLASWKPTGDSSIYAMEDVLLNDVITYSQKQGINFYAVIIKALSLAVQDEPQINSSVIRHKIKPRKNISVFFHVVNKDNDDDLGGVRLINPQKMEIGQLSTNFIAKVDEARQGKGPYADSKSVVAKTPRFLVKPLLNLYAFFAYRLNKNLGLFKSPDDAFGSIMVTAVGSLGISKALCPIAPYTHVPMVISIGKIEERPVVLNGKIEIRQMATFGFTFDHRIMEGIHFKKLFDRFSFHLSALTHGHE